MDIQEVKRFSDEILEAMTEKDKSGRGYICPACGAGSGKNGTGLTKVRNRPGYYHCFSAGCPFEHGDILQLIKVTYNLPETSQQIEKAGQLIHRDFSEKNYKDNTPWFNKAKSSNQSGKENKNMVQNSDVGTEDKNIVINQENLKKEQEEIRAYMEAAAAALPTSITALTYLTQRGISKETAERFKIGYVPNYGDGMNSPAIIIPTGKYSYTARSMTLNEEGKKIRKRKAGEKAGVFGIGALNNPPPICFIVEGEIDKLSVNEAGFPAISTGGGTSKREVAEKIKALGNIGTTFYIIPDNDILPDGRPDYKKGYKAGMDLLDMMQSCGIRTEFVDVANEQGWPKHCKDCNDFLKENRAGFITFLNEKRLALEEKELGRVSGYMQDFVLQISGNTPPIATGFNKLDAILEGGLHPGLIVIGAISSLGKTTFVLNIADMLATKGQDVIFYSLEMSKFELISKIISRRTALTCLLENMPMHNAKTNLGISDFKRYKGDKEAGIKGYSDDELDLIYGSMNNFSEGAAQHLYIREGMQNIGTANIRQDIQKHEFYTGRRPVIVVDYLQILKSPDVHMTDKQKTDENVIELKRISRDYNIPVIGISSFNRDNYKEPVSMAAYKESGAIEYTSDVLIGMQYFGMDYQEGDTDKKRTENIRKIFKENEQNARSGKSISIQCKVLKNRSGGKTDCIFDYFPMFNLYLEQGEE